MPEVRVRKDIMTLHEPVCHEHEWLGRREQHRLDAFNQWVAHAVSHHPEMVETNQYERTITYTKLEGERQDTTAVAKGEALEDLQGTIGIRTEPVLANRESEEKET